MNLENYISAGYFLSRHTGKSDSTGTILRRATIASDHCQREFFPDTWAISWCGDERAERIRRAAVFGIAESDLGRVFEWTDSGFEKVFGAWSVFFEVDEARKAATRVLPSSVDVAPESRHLDEQAVLAAVGVAPNADGLLDSFEDGLACCRWLDEHAAETRHGIRGWLPWLIVDYPIR